MHIPGQFKNKWPNFKFQEQGKIQGLFKVCANPVAVTFANMDIITRLPALAYIPWPIPHNPFLNTNSFPSAHQIIFTVRLPSIGPRRPLYVVTWSLLGYLLGYFSCSCWAIKIASVLPLPGDKAKLGVINILCTINLAIVLYG